MSRLRAALATGLGTGYLPIAPGTWGSAAAACVYLALSGPFGVGPAGCSISMAAVVLAGAVVCVALGPFAERHFGRKDPSQVTADEWAGQALALIGLPAATTSAGLLIIVGAAFAAFRLFDILKPPPANGLQRLPAGWGILVDDLIAGAYANVAAQAVLRLAVPALGAVL